MARDGSGTPGGVFLPSSECEEAEVEDLTTIDVQTLLKRLQISLDHVYCRLKHEKIETAAELAILDKEDLKEIGFKMTERCRILKWAREHGDSGAPLSRTPSGDQKNVSFACCAFSGGGFESGHSLLKYNRSESIAVPHILDDEEEHRLDKIEEEEKLWLDCFKEQKLPKQEDESSEWLQCFFDITTSRINEIFDQLDANGDGEIDKNGMKEAFKRLGLDGLSDEGIDSMYARVSSLRGKSLINKKELESISTRLKLTPLLRADDDKKDVDLTCIDYKKSDVAATPVDTQTRTQRRSFFFGHRKRTDGEPLVRWVHLGNSDSNIDLLLALAMKYQLHPLQVEDVIEQSPTRFDRYDSHYFLQIERLVLIEDNLHSARTVPVRVKGRHTTISCSGPPHFDTVITISQPDKSFSRDWPKDYQESDTANTNSLGFGEDKWLAKLKQRLGVGPKALQGQKHRSRLLEKRADFLMYAIVDLCSDDLVLVTQAFSARLKQLEEEFRTKAWDPKMRSWDPKDLEVSRVSLQLNVVSRRLRGMQRLVRKWRDDRDVSADLPGYLQDVLDHLEEAYDDTVHLTSKCAALISDYERAIDQVQEKRMNITLFFLAVATFIFCPLQFMAGVYGMNFVDDAGTPTIPELLVPRGYEYFWIGTITWICLSGSAAVWGYNKTIRSEVGDNDFFPKQAAVPSLPGGGSMDDLRSPRGTSSFNWRASKSRGPDSPREASLSSPLLLNVEPKKH